MKKLSLTLLFVSILPWIVEAKVLEAKQLFNKEVVAVKKQTINERQSFYGNTAINTGTIEDIVVRFDGYITSLNASKDYMMLKKGEGLFSIYSNEVQTIQKELHILKKVNQKIAQSSYEKLIALDINAKELNRIKHASKALEDVTFYAPFNALLLKRNINKGSFAKKGALLLQLANIEQLWFIAKVYQKDLAFVQKGMKAEVKIDGVSQPLISSVDYVYPFLDEKKQTVDVRFVIDNPELKLTPNMFGKVNVITQSKTALTLPKSAVITKGEKHYVFLYIGPNQYEPVEVQAKRIGSHLYVISNGVNEGEKVINNALFLMDSDAITNALYSSDDDEW